MKGHLAKVSSANRVLKCNRLKPVPVGGFIGILPRKTTLGVSQGITLFSQVTFISKKWGHFNTWSTPKKKPTTSKQTNKKKKNKKIYLTTRLAAVEHLLQLCKKKMKQTEKSISFYSIAV